MCTVNFDDFDSPKAWVEHERRARVQHRCDACRGVIQPGDYYLKHFSSMGGKDICSQRMCAPCSVIRDAFSTAHGMWSVPRRLKYDLEECLANGDDGDDASFHRWRPMIAEMEARYLIGPAQLVRGTGTLRVAGLSEVYCG